MIHPGTGINLVIREGIEPHTNVPPTSSKYSMVSCWPGLTHLFSLLPDVQNLSLPVVRAFLASLINHSYEYHQHCQNVAQKTKLMQYPCLPKSLLSLTKQYYRHIFLLLECFWLFCVRILLEPWSFRITYLDHKPASAHEEEINQCEQSVNRCYGNSTLDMPWEYLDPDQKKSQHSQIAGTIQLSICWRNCSYCEPFHHTDTTILCVSSIL